ncbi:RNA dependent RNA polymerase-domain-containing protein [Cokeromyces recurvatus]|uniref:RNA dependent RNA polymerase-domain-containing protein n=1 Tax=Cokeromyces recurvatus TaxID=90255 RepID=UPI00221EDF33|nr:RNA dependent RNA polymerase-domain-containing protein [Cokeromyces recurvatus]KAI7908225.1 RNA dependent RNA polymerase-domain-containing protein [Cokeromyces recurvatus]
MTVSLNPFISRCAKQIYHNLKLTDRIGLLSNEVLPAEVIKMQQVLLLLDQAKLESLVKKFLQTINPNKSLDDFMFMLDSELKVFSAEDEEFTDDIDENILVELTEQSVKKRTRSHSEDPFNSIKKFKPTPEHYNTAHTTTAIINFFSTDTLNSETYNIICNPAGSSKLLHNVPWIILYEIARFIHAYEISWEDIPFDAFQMFLNIGNTEPSQLYETMVKWNQEVRLGLKINALAYTSMERCPDNVWAHIQQLQKASSLSESNLTPCTSTPASTSASTSASSTPSPLSPNLSSPYNLTATKKQNARVKNRMIHYSGILKFKNSANLPSIRLRAPKVEASNRFFRKFGPDRFLELSLSKGIHPSLIKAHMNYFLKPFLFMQRIYQFLFVKDDTLVLFATRGPGLEPISIQQVIDWHMPITENWNMSMSKYASRMALGYSSSIPTLEFKPEEIIYVDDIYSSTGSATDETACMTDGCGIISCSAMRQIMGCQATDELPCAIQGRIAGAKGIWIISPDLDFTSGNWIKIRASQNKFKTGLPQKDFSLDPHHYTFDLVKNSICVYPSNLNTQFIQCLAAGGVPTAVFVEILKEYIHRLATIVTENQSVEVLRDWITRMGHVMMGRWEGESNTEKGLWRDLNSSSAGLDDENDSGFFTISSPDDDTYFDDHNIAESNEDRPEYDWRTRFANNDNHYFRLNRYSGSPASLHEAAIRMLDSGFDLSNAYLASRITMVFRQVMQSITTKYKIEVPQSCTVTCIPDPTGTLESGEMFLQLSNRRMDEKTSIPVGQILGEVIVTRNPCALKSDIQKVKAVDCSALRMYRDVAVFSVKGETSLASQLSGGDYDGDIIFCCWDERIVKPFKSSPVIPESNKVKEAFDKDMSTVGREVGSHENTETAIQKNFISVTIPDGTLGIYENWRTVLAETTNLDNPDVIYLGHMCSKLVDAPKQGLRLKSIVKNRDRASFGDIPHPAWFMDKKNKQRNQRIRNYREVNNVYALQNAPLSTTMDYLYDTLMKETAAFTKYSRSMFLDEDVPFKDPDLIAPWLKAQELANQLNDIALKDDLQLIAQAIEKNRHDYNKQCCEFDMQKQHYMDNIGNPKHYIDSKFVHDFQNQFTSHFELEEYFAKEFLNTPSTQSLKSNIMIFDIQANGGRMLQNIKASYAYQISVNANKYSKYCYIVAFDFLRRIKADAIAKRLKENGVAETITVPMYKCLNIDRKWLKRLLKSNIVNEKEKVRLMPDITAAMNGELKK